MSSNKMAADSDVIEYRQLTAEHVEETARVLSEAFIHGELLNHALGLSFEEQLKISREMCQLALKDRVGMVAISSRTNKVVGAIVGTVITGADHLANATTVATPAVNDESDLFTKSATPFLQVLRKFFHLHPKLIDGNLDKDCKIAKGSRVGVLPSYLGRGIGKTLVDLQVKYLFEMGCKFVIFTTTSPESEKMFRKAGYEVIGELPYKDFAVEHEKPFSRITTSYSAKAMMKAKL